MNNDTNLRINNETSIGLEEVSWRFSRSGGPGGQNVNKVETRVTLIFDVNSSRYLTDSQKQMVLERLSGLIDKVGVLQISVDEERSQLRNRGIALERFRAKLAMSFRTVKPRKKTRISRAKKEERLREKHHKSDIKRNRQDKDHLNDGY